MELGTTLNNTDVWFSKGVLVLLLRAGFVLIQISCVPNNNVNKLVFQNLADIGISTALYVCIGYTLAFGKDIFGIVGAPDWVPLKEMHFDLAMLGWNTITVSGAILAAAVAGRISVLGQMLSSAVLAGVVQPLVLHWVRSGTGWLTGYWDQGGGATAHASGGMAALVATAFLGRRLLLLRELDECSLPPSSPGNIFTGYILVMVGLLAMSHPRTAVINNVAAAGGGALAIAVLQKAMGSRRLGYWKVVTCFQGAAAAVVTVAPGLDLYHPTLALALGTFGAMISHLVTRLCSLCFLEDYMNLVPVHLVCGILGTLIPPMYSPNYVRGDVGKEICWQLLGVAAIVALTAAALVPLFCVMTWCTILRDGTETRNHLRALRVANDNTSVFWLGRIFRTHRGLPQLRPGYRSKDVEAFLDSVTRSEVQDVQRAREPRERLQISQETSFSRPQNVSHLDDSIANSDKEPLNDPKLHVIVFGREPLSKDIRLENSPSGILQDSHMELVECGTPGNRCGSQKMHEVCYMNIDEKYPATISAHKLYNSSVLMPGGDVGDKDAPSTETTRPSMDFEKYFSILIEESFKHDMDQNTAEELHEMLYLNKTNTEDENLEETSARCVSGIFSDGNRHMCLFKSNSLSNVVDYDDHFSESAKEGDSSVKNTTDFGHTRNINTLHSPVLLAYRRCTSEDNLNTSFSSKITYSKRMEKSDSNLTAENKLKVKYLSMKRQLEESAGNINGTMKIETKSDVSKHVVLLNKFKNKFK